MMDKFLVSAKELAKEIPIGEHKLRDLEKNNKTFPVIKKGNQLLFIKSEVEEWFRKYSWSDKRI